MRTLQLQEAKQHFSEVAREASRNAPQVVTRHGKPYVVIVSVEAWQQASGKENSVFDLMQTCPEDLNELDIKRLQDPPRQAAVL